MTCSVKIRLVVLCVSVVVLAGCSKEFSGFAFFKGSSTWGAEQIIENEDFRKVNLAEVLDQTSISSGGAAAGKAPMGGNNEKTAKKAKPGAPAGAPAGGGSGGVPQPDVDRALSAFYLNLNLDMSDAPRLARNRVQERLLAASAERCGEYKNFLKQLDAETNLLLGTLTTTIAGAGSIATGASQILSGTAAIFSGVRSEFNSELFQQKTIQVITAGIDAKRQELYDQISERQALELKDYSVEAAIKDANEFHAKCSLIAGLEHAALTVARSEDPGENQRRKFLKGKLRADAEEMSGELKIEVLTAYRAVAAADADVAAAQATFDMAQAKFDAAKGTSDEAAAMTELDRAKNALDVAKVRQQSVKARVATLEAAVSKADEYKKSLENPGAQTQSPSQGQSDGQTDGKTGSGADAGKDKKDGEKTATEKSPAAGAKDSVRTEELKPAQDPKTSDPAKKPVQ